MITEKKNYSLDILRFIALLCIILAHSNPSESVLQIRNFDVPLMIIISVWLSIRTVNIEGFRYLEYIKKRIKRLIIPTWTFLTIYFLVYFLIGRVYPIKTILASYLLISGIGYTWVIRIYIYVAIVTPLINKVHKKINKYNYITLIIFIYVIYTFLIRVTGNQQGIVKLLIDVAMIDFIGYSLVVFVAIFVSNLNNKDMLKVGLIFAIILVALGVKYNFVPTQQFKYPVRLYYLAYAFSISFMLYSLLNYFLDYKIKTLKISKIIMFISRNSMWIYLWHILYIDIVNRMFNNINWGYIPRFLVLIILASVTTYIQNLIKPFFLSHDLSKI